MGQSSLIIPNSRLKASRRFRENFLVRALKQVAPPACTGHLSQVSYVGEELLSPSDLS